MRDVNVNVFHVVCPFCAHSMLGLPRLHRYGSSFAGSVGPGILFGLRKRSKDLGDYSSSQVLLKSGALLGPMEFLLLLFCKEHLSTVQ